METVLNEWRQLMTGLNNVHTHEVVKVRREMEWILTLVEDGKMRVQKEFMKVQLANFRDRLTKLGILT